MILSSGLKNKAKAYKVKLREIKIKQERLL